MATQREKDKTKENAIFGNNNENILPCLTRSR